MDQSKVSTIPAWYFDSIQEIVWNSYCRNIVELANGIDCLSQHVIFWELVQRSHAPNKLENCPYLVVKIRKLEIRNESLILVRKLSK